MIKTASEQVEFRAAGLLLRRLTAYLKTQVRIGITPLELDALAEAYIREELGCTPAFKGLYGFPNTVCVSVNDAVVHGLPDSTPFISGDLVSVDYGLISGDWHTDTAFSAYLGTAPANVRRLMEGTEKALQAGIAQCRAGNQLNAIGNAIAKVLVAHDLGIIIGLGGHGIGRAVHEDPHIPNHFHPDPTILRAGMTFCLEPMATLAHDGTHQVFPVKDADGWTLRSPDGSLSAHYEHMVLVTDGDPEILS